MQSVLPSRLASSIWAAFLMLFGACSGPSEQSTPQSDTASAQRDARAPVETLEPDADGAGQQNSPQRGVDETRDTSPRSPASIEEPDAADDTEVALEPSESVYVIGEVTLTLLLEPIDIDLRRYTFTTTASLPNGAPQSRSIDELPQSPRLRSGRPLVDALFALAIVEAGENAVSTLSDPSFSQNAPCDCFTTGALWQWVWTRDIAYAVDLSLAWLAPERSEASLRFKLSETKAGGGIQIVQDTGSGGSWPVSSDRAVWARGASALLPFLSTPGPFKQLMKEALTNTHAIDKAYLFDSDEGLYRGEASFLDWREQSYPTWTAQNTVHIAMGKALSTNLAHLSLLRALDSSEAAPLAEAIDAAFWQNAGYASVIGTSLDGAPSPQRDLLGTALALIDLKTHPEAISTYPFAPGGPPVFWPQQPFTPIYHNRASWPFVTAYAALAAREAKNAEVFNAAFEALIAGAAKHISHMENVEYLSGDAYVADGEFSGPLINSQRQLWSIAGFLGVVVRGVFGMEASSEGVRFVPFVTDEAWEGATLYNFPFRGERIDVTLSLTEGPAPEWLDSGQATLHAELSEGGEIHWLDTSAWQNLYAPQEPACSLEGRTLTFSAEAGAQVDIWAEGVLVAANASSPYEGVEGRCYSLRARFPSSGTVSQPSQPVCTWPEGGVKTYEAESFIAVGGNWSTQHGKAHYENWGAAHDTITLSISPNYSGEHLLQVVYGNGSGPINTGITCASKWLTIKKSEGFMVSEGPLIMPQLGNWGEWRDSNFVTAELIAGESYEVSISEGFNMSYLRHYEDYLGAGGGLSTSNYVNISQLKLLYR